LPAALAAITVLRAGTEGHNRHFELRLVSIHEDAPLPVAYIAAGSLDELVDIVPALSDVANGPPAA
jgi:hypothetical protein